MNIIEYRPSFTIFVADSHVGRGGEICEHLSNAGYNVEQRLSFQSLKDEVIRNPPHMVIFNYDDQIYFQDSNAYRECIDFLLEKLPEVQIFFLATKEQFERCCDLYEYGIYDCLQYPAVHERQILRSIDRAAEINYFLYLNEQLRESNNSHAPDFAHLEVFNKNADRCKSRDELIDLFLREGLRHLKTDVGIYMRFNEHKRTLVATRAVGLDEHILQGVGVDLQNNEPGFFARQLLEPWRMSSIQEFVVRGLRRSRGLTWPLSEDERPHGIFVFASPLDSQFRQHANDDGYMNSIRHSIELRIQRIQLQQKLTRFSIYDAESEALNETIFKRKLEEEVSRARRIEKPVALVLVAIDNFQDLILEKPPETMQVFARSFRDVLQKTSRVNDMVGRVAPDIFALCLPHTPKRGAIIKAERVRRMIESADFSAILGSHGRLTASVSLSEYPSVSRDSQDIMRSAEKSLVETIRLGKNRVGIAGAPGSFTPDFLVTDATTSVSTASRRS